jgi:hypothetical protein
MPISVERLTFESQWLHVQHSNLDSFLRQKLHHVRSNAIAASGYNDYLLIPVISVRSPVVLNSVVQEIRETLEKANGQQCSQALQHTRVLGSERLALLCVSRKEYQRKYGQRIQHRTIEESRNGVSGKAWLLR